MKKTIFDFGMNDGDDTAYYLAKGYDVIAVEANPYLCAIAAKRFNNQINSGSLTILNAAITNSNGECIFYVNTDNHHWSSLDINWATRNCTNAIPCPVKCISYEEIIYKYGNPYFLKIDIEGGDMTVLEQLLACQCKPEFLSIEDCRLGFIYINLLHTIGYHHFKLSNQSITPLIKDLEIDYQFKLGCSGKFGNELDGPWFDHDTFLDIYKKVVRNPDTLDRLSEPSIWWDIHCTI